MLQKEFFQVQPFNPNPYWDPVIVNLSGAQKFEEDTVFMPGKYRIELAPGTQAIKPEEVPYNAGALGYIVNMDYLEEIAQPFIIRAYCGGSGNYASKIPGTNPYIGPYKVNAIDARTINRDNYPTGIDVNHIFGAGGGNHRYYNSTSGTGAGTSYGGGANCLGDGSWFRYSDYGSGDTNYVGGAGSCLHLLPIGGTFGVDYIRAYQAAAHQTDFKGSAYGGGQGHRDDSTSTGSFYSRGGNSSYGNGSSDYYQNGQFYYTDTGIGGGNKIGPGDSFYPYDMPRSAGAYFNGTMWIDSPGNVKLYTRTSNTTAIKTGKDSYIKITYLGPLD